MGNKDNTQTQKFDRGKKLSSIKKKKHAQINKKSMKEIECKPTELRKNR